MKNIYFASYTTATNASNSFNMLMLAFLNAGIERPKIILNLEECRIYFGYTIDELSKIDGFENQFNFYCPNNMLSYNAPATNDKNQSPHEYNYNKTTFNLCKCNELLPPQSTILILDDIFESPPKNEINHDNINSNLTSPLIRIPLPSPQTPLEFSSTNSSVLKLENEINTICDLLKYINERNPTNEVFNKINKTVILNHITPNYKNRLINLAINNNTSPKVNNLHELISYINSQKNLLKPEVNKDLPK